MDRAAPGRNEDELPALIYRNDPEVAKGNGSGAAGGGHLGHSGEHERVELSATEFLPQGKISYSGEPAATHGRKRCRSLEARSIASEGLIGGPLREDGGGEEIGRAHV